jgi:hypothetical protein
MADAQINSEVARGLALRLVEQQFQTQNTTLSSLVDKAINAYRDGQAEKSLQMLAGDICPYTEEDVKGVILENLSSQDRDPKTGQRKVPAVNTPEKDRYDKTQEVADAIRVYLENDGKEIHSEFINELIAYVKHMPQYRDILYDQNGQLRQQEAQTIAQTLLRQPQYRRIIHKLFTERLDPKKRLASINAYEALKREIQALETQIKKLPEEVTKEQINKAKEDLEQARQELLKVSGQRTQLEILKANALQDQRNLNRLLLLQSELEAQIDLQFMEKADEDLQAARELLLATTDPQSKKYIQEQINQIEQDPNYQKFLPYYKRYKSTQQQIAEILSRKQQIEDLSQSITQAESDFQQKKQEYEELLRRQASSQTSQERARLEAELERKKLELKDLEAQLIAERMRYASDIIAIPAEAAKEFFNEALGEAAKHYKEEAKKAAEKEKADRKLLEEQAIEKLGRSLGRREKRKRGGETVPVPDKKESRRLLTLLFQPSGLQGFIDEVAKNKKTLMGYGLTEEEANSILAKKSDPEFVKTVGQNLAKKVLCDYLLAGGRLSRDDIFAIADTDWGKSIIEDGLKLSEEQKKFLESQLGKGVLKTLDEIKGGKTTSEWLKGNWLKIAGIIALLILFGLIGSSVAQSIPGIFSRG